MSSQGRPVTVILDMDDRVSEFAGIVTSEASDGDVYVVRESSGSWIDTRFEDSVFTVKSTTWSEEHDAIAKKYWITEGEPEQRAKTP